MAWKENELQNEPLEEDPAQAPFAGGGPSSDTQGLSPDADESEESVEELAETGQAYEADVIEGVEDAAEHPERPVIVHEERRRTGGRADEGR